jgi:hypothetical protein
MHAVVADDENLKKAAERGDTAMKDEILKGEKQALVKRVSGGGLSMPNRLLGSLRDALAAAAREDTVSEIVVGETTEPKVRKTDAVLPPIALPHRPSALAATNANSLNEAPIEHQSSALSVAESVRLAKAPIRVTSEHRHLEADPSTTRLVRGAELAAVCEPVTDAVRTQIVRGKPKVTHTGFEQDPVVGWLVVVGGKGLGAFRPIFEGNNTLGRSPTQRIAIDFGDDSISAEEQGYIRYDSFDRSFLFVPNMAKTNVVAVNDMKPTSAVPLSAMDVITVGRTQLAFVPFCSEEFDWSDLTDARE